MHPRRVASVVIACVVVATALIAAMPQSAPAAPAPTPAGRATPAATPAQWRNQTPEIDRAHLFVRYRSRSAAASRRVARAGVRAEHTLRSGWTRLDTTRDATEVKEALEQDPAIATVEHSYIRRALAMPNDPRWSSEQKGYLLPLRLNRAWDITRGQYRDDDDNLVPVVVAVVDSGVNPSHPDLAGRVLAGWSVLSGQPNAMDEYGHGTLVAGTIAANIDNARGITGVAPKAKILPVRVLDGLGGGSDADIIDGIYWAADHGAQVINLSIGGPGSNTALDDAVAYARDTKDIVVVGAAGNGASDEPNYPGASAGVITVSATSHTGEFAAFSTWGPQVDLAAPGLEITSTAYEGSATADDYLTVSGTSLSSPIVAGVAALVRAHEPDLDHEAVETLLRESARDVGPPGVDRAYGYGMVDPLAALGGTPLAPKPALPAGGDEPNDTPVRATALTIGVTKTAQIAPETDEDWYTVTLGTGWHSVFVPADFEELDHSMQPIVELYDDDNNYLSGQEFVGGSLVFNVDATGTYRIRVRNRGADTNPYSVTVSTRGAPPLFGDGSSGEPISLPIPPPFGLYAQSAGIGDVTGDGRNDVVVFVADPLLDEPGIVVLEQTPFQSLVVGDILDVTGTVTGNGLVVGDADGDGDDDILYPTTTGVVLRRQGDSEFEDAEVLGSGNVNQVAIAEIDGDSAPEIVTAGTGAIKVLWGDGTTDPTDVAATAATSIDVGDVNGDDKADIVAAGGGGILTALRDGTDVHAFGTATVETIAGVRNVAIDPATDDVFATIRTSAALRRYEYDATPLIQVGASISVRARPDSLVIADVDGGGNDAVMMHSDSSGRAGYVKIGSTSETQLDLDVFGLSTYDSRALAVGDVDNDGLNDMVVATVFGVGISMHRKDDLPTNYPNHFLTNTLPPNISTDVDPEAYLELDLTSVPDDVASVKLLDADGHDVPANVVAGNPLVIDPDDPLEDGAYTLVARGLSDTDDDFDDFDVHFLVGDPPDETAPSVSLVSPPAGFEYTAQQTVAFTSNDGAASFICSTDNGDWSPCTSPITKSYSAGAHKVQVIAVDAAGNESSIATASWTYRAPPKGYWMLGAGGKIYKFGTGSNLGSASTSNAVDVEMSPTGYGYWIVNASGRVFRFGDAAYYGNFGALKSGESVTSISRTKNGKGYWLFTNRGRVIARGNAVFRGDLRNKVLNGPVLDSVTTPSGNGYYMVASDGGVFTFGDAKFKGSTGNRRISAPVRTLTPDPDGTGYWLVGRDGAVYSFNATFRGSMAGKHLNKPIVGMVSFGNGYLMVASDGGIFNFSNKAFYGSLGANPPSIPIVSVAAYG